jgi:hypothetical protein
MSFAVFTAIPFVIYSQVPVAPTASVAALCRFTETTGRFSFPFDRQPSGLYEVVFQTNEGKSVRKIVKVM